MSSPYDASNTAIELQPPVKELARQIVTPELIPHETAAQTAPQPTVAPAPSVPADSAALENVWVSGFG